MKITFKVRVLNFFRNVFKIPVLEKFLAARTSGKDPNQLICKLVPNPYQYKAGEIRQVKRGGVFANVDISDFIGHYLYFGFKDDSFDSLLALCKTNSFVLDIGTNIGWVALNLAHKANQGKVLGFEPDQFNYTQASRNLALNKLTNLSIFPIGLGHENKKLNLEIRTPSNRGGNRITPSYIQNGKSTPVEIKRLDDFLRENKIQQVDLIKIDVEGFEYKVLMGANQVLQKCKPVLFIELDDNNLRDQGDSARALVENLTNMGYQIQNAETKESISSQSNFSNCHFDIIATHG